MDKEEAKAIVLNKLTKLLKTLSSLALKPQTKLAILQRVIYPRISFELKVYDFALTWITNSLDSLVHAHIRQWLELPISTCLEEIASLPVKMCGLNLPSLRNYAVNLRTTVRFGLKSSSNSDMRHLWNVTSRMNANINVDSAVSKSTSVLNAKKSIKIQVQNAALNHVTSLELQGLCIKAAIDNIKSSTITAWSKTINSLPTVLFKFTRKGLQQQLPTSSNLSRWGKIPPTPCPLCKEPQTNKHVLSNCSATCALDRYKLRHDSILLILCNWLKTVLVKDAALHADIPGFQPIGSIFVNFRPDIVVILKDTVHVCELTVCHETNLEKSRNYKCNKYENIQNNLKTEYLKFITVLHTIEMSVLGFMSDCSSFTKTVANSKIPNDIYANMICNVIGNSYNIYLNRNYPV